MNWTHSTHHPFCVVSATGAREANLSSVTLIKILSRVRSARSGKSPVGWLPHQPITMGRQSQSFVQAADAFNLAESNLWDSLASPNTSLK